MTCFQNLRGAFRAFRKGDDYISNILCRNVIEYYITWKYIDKDPETRIPQFVDAPLRGQLRFSETVEGIIEEEPDLIDVEPVRIKERKTELIGQIDAGIESHGAWNKIIEQRAIDVGLENLYNMPYRLLSTIIHPDALQSDNYFTEENDGTVKICPFRDMAENSIRSLQTGFWLANEMFSQLAGIFDLPNQDQYEVLIRRTVNHVRSKANST